MSFGSFFLSKKIKETWFKSKEEKLNEIFSSDLEKVKQKHQEYFDNLNSEIREREDSLISKQRDVEDLLRRVNDKRVELETRNEELRDQIRLIEAKASPSGVWVQAFSQGFSKAWDMMIPLMTSGIEKTKEKIKELAIEESLNNIEPVIQSRLSKLGKTSLKDANEILKKKEELKIRINKAEDEEKLQLTHYLEALEWIYNADSQTV